MQGAHWRVRAECFTSRGGLRSSQTPDYCQSRTAHSLASRPQCSAKACGGQASAGRPEQEYCGRRGRTCPLIPSVTVSVDALPVHHLSVDPLLIDPLSIDPVPHERSDTARGCCAGPYKLHLMRPGKGQGAAPLMVPLPGKHPSPPIAVPPLCVPPAHHTPHMGQ